MGQLSVWVGRGPPRPTRGYASAPGVTNRRTAVHVRTAAHLSADPGQIIEKRGGKKVTTIYFSRSHCIRVLNMDRLTADCVHVCARLHACVPVYCMG